MTLIVGTRPAGVVWTDWESGGMCHECVRLAPQVGRLRTNSTALSLRAARLAGQVGHTRTPFTEERMVRLATTLFATLALTATAAAQAPNPLHMRYDGGAT